jgi:hypothetical protein
MRGKAIFVSGLVLLMLLTFIAPVMAAPAQKLPIVLVTSGHNISPPEKTWTTDGGIIHSIGGVRGGPVTLKIGTGPTITGTYSESGNMVTNTKTHETIVNFNRMVCTFPDGSFEGAKTAKITSALINGAMTTVAQEQHGVLQGSGIYEGQTLKIEQDYVLGDPTKTKDYFGILIVP